MNTTTEALQVVCKIANQLDPRIFNGPHYKDRLRHVSVKHNCRDAFMATAQLHDASSNGETWMVVGSTLEAAWLEDDLRNDYLGPNALDKSKLCIWDGNNSEKGGICIFTYQQFVRDMVLPAKAAGWSLSGGESDITVYMDWGCGDFTFQMGVAIMGVTAVVRAHHEAQTRRVGVYVFSNVEVNPWGWEKSEILVPDDSEWNNSRTVTFKDDDEPRVSETVAFIQDIWWVQSQNKSSRMLLVLGKSRLPTVLKWLPKGTITSSTESWRIENKSDHTSHIIMHPDFFHLGTVENISSIIVDPEKVAWVMDGALTQMCLHTVKRSRSELRLIADIKAAQGPLPPIHYMMSEAQFDALSELPATSLALTRDLAKTLLVSIDFFFNMISVPITLRGRGHLIVQEVMTRLENQKLVEMVKHADLLVTGYAHGEFVLTNYGKRVTRYVLEEGIDEIGAACLLAHLEDPPVAPAQLTTSPAMIDAVYSIATVLSLTKEVARMPMIVNIVEANKDTFSEQFMGVAEPYVKTGPIWQAVAIWHKLKTDKNWRFCKDVKSFQILQATSGEPTVIEHDAWSINVLQSFAWDQEYKHLLDLQVGGAVPRFDPLSRLTKDEKLALDEALVWSFLDRILVVPFINGDAEPTYAVDLVSKRKVSRGSLTQTRQLDLKFCRELDRKSRVDGKELKAIYCIYTALGRVGEGDAQHWVAYDVTYVQAVAVRRVLRQLEMAPWQRGDSRNRLNVLASLMEQDNS